MVEVWKPVKDYEGIYEISNIGRVRSKHKHTKSKDGIIKERKTRNGYCHVELWKNGTGVDRYIHRLVALAFIPNPNNLPEINHKDENPSNNCVDNLEWCDRTYNNNYGNHYKKMVETRGDKYVGANACHRRRVMCVETGEIFETIRSASRIINVNQAHISNCCRGKRNKCGGYHWKYID